MQMQTIELFKAMAITEYDVNTKKDFLNYLRKHFNNQKSKLFLFSRRANSPQTILIDLKLPGVFQSQTYDVNLLIYFPVHFPNSPPEIYLRNMGNLKINPQCAFYILEETLKINFELFFQWRNQIDDLASLLTELKHQFSFAFPVFNINNSSAKQFSGDCVFPMNSVMEIIMPSSAPSNDITNINISSIEPKQSQQQQSIVSNNNPYTNINSSNPNYISNIQFDQSNIMKSKTMQNVSVNNLSISKETEERAKKKLIIQLILQFKGKIRDRANKNKKAYLDLKYLKNSFEKKINQLNLIENNKQELNGTIQNLEKEVSDYDLPVLPDRIDTTDLSQLDNLFDFNKTMFSTIAKESALEELLSIIKKGFEKEAIDFPTAVKQYRIHSRLLFLMKKSQEINIKK